MQRNLKRMFTEAPLSAPKRSRQHSNSSRAAEARESEAHGVADASLGAAANQIPAQAAASQCTFASESATVTAAELPHSLEQSEAGTLLNASRSRESVSERFAAAEARRASTAPTLLGQGQLRVGGELVAQLMDKQTWKPVAASERCNGHNLYWQRVPCKERPWVRCLCRTLCLPGVGFLL